MVMIRKMMIMTTMTAAMKITVLSFIIWTPQKVEYRTYAGFCRHPYVVCILCMYVVPSICHFLRSSSVGRSFFFPPSPPVFVRVSVLQPTPVKRFSISLIMYTKFLMYTCLSCFFCSYSSSCSFSNCSSFLRWLIYSSS